MQSLLRRSNIQVISLSQGVTDAIPATTAGAVHLMKHSPSHPGSAFRIAVAVSLLAGALLMFGSLQYAAARMQVTM